MRLVRQHFLRTALAGASLLALAACDRVEEPHSGDPPRPLTATAGSGISAPPKRCLKAWGPKPKREPFLQGFVAPDCPDRGDDLTPPPPKDPLRTAKITFPDAARDGGPAPVLTVELADSGTTRQRGLMLRRSMPEEGGMLFVFEESKVQAFWMHNTCIPLDMLYVDRDGFIAGIEENVPTMNDDTYSVGCPTLYVLEVNAGWSRRHGVAPGQTVKIEGL